jgi:cation:H+ antiporter
LIYLYKLEDKTPISVEEQKHHIHWDVTFAIIGLVILLGSSTIVLRTAEILVHTTGLGGSLIGVLSLGVASALPELFTAIQGARKGEKGIAIGTLIGSNITNPLLAIGVGSLISTYVAPRPLIFWDLPFGILSACLLLIWLLYHKKKVDKGGAIYLILLYFVYIGIRIWFFSVD